MAHSNLIRRKLYMHPAHRTVGVAGGGIELRPYGPVEEFSASHTISSLPSTTDPLAPALRVTLLADRWDSDARASMTAFRQAVEEPGRLCCRCLEPASLALGLEETTDADCVAYFQRGFMGVARRWSDLDAAASAADRCVQPQNRSVRIEIVPAARRHPLLVGIGPFDSRLDAAANPTVSDEAAVLLIGRTSCENWPVAWLEPFDRGRTFRTILGLPEDFSQPDFVRFLLGVLRWFGR